MQAIVRQAAPAARLVGPGDRRRVGRDPGDPKLVEQGLDFRCEPGGMAGLADDAALDPAPQLAQEAVGNARLEGQARRQLD